MVDPDATHYAAPATQRTGCGLHRDGRHAVTRDSDRVSCPECQEELARVAERRLRGPPPIGEPSYVGVRGTLREVSAAAEVAAPWAVEIAVKNVPGIAVVTVLLRVHEDLEYYRDHAHLVAGRLLCVLPVGVELRVEVELAGEIFMNSQRP